MGIRRAVGVLCAAVLIAAGSLGMSATAHAAAPAAPVPEFNAGLCAGTTVSDPWAATVWDDVNEVSVPGPVPDLTRVWGPRLDAYNAGNVVPLHDVWGENNFNGYPPICGVRYVEGVGPVSEWMYCTDYEAHVCSGVDASGNLVDVDGVPIPNMEANTGANAKLTPDQEKIIAYLVTHGWTRYIGFGGQGGFDFADSAQPLGDSWQRSALQVLVWCVSDPVTLPVANASEQDRKDTCDASLTADDTAAILAAFGPDPALSMTGPTAELRANETATFTISTNAAAGSLTLGVSGVAGSLAVVSGDATLTGDQLVLTSTPGAQTVVLGFTAASAGTVTLQASATPAATESIGWNQSPGIAADMKPCQIFATFRQDHSVTLQAAASATFIPADSTGGGDGDDGGDDGGGDDGGGPKTPHTVTKEVTKVSITRLANTGVDASAHTSSPLSLIAIAFGAVLVGAACSAGAHARKRAER